MSVEYGVGNLTTLRYTAVGGSLMDQHSKYIWYCSMRRIVHFLRAEGDSIRSTTA